MKGNELVFDYVQLLHCNCHQINANGGGSYIDSPDWIDNNKATVNLINKKITNVFSTLYSRVKS